MPKFLFTNLLPLSKLVNLYKAETTNIFFQLQIDSKLET